MADNTEIKGLMDDAIKDWGVTAVEHVIDIVLKVFNDKYKSKLEKSSFERYTMSKDNTPDELRDKILAKHFKDKVAKDRIDIISDKVELVFLAKNIIDISQNIYHIYEITDMYVRGQETSPDEMLSTAFETIGSIINNIPGCTYVASVLELGNDILEISAQMVKDYVSQYEQIEAMINGAEESDTISDADAAAITTVYNDITALANSGDIEVMNFAYGMLNDYGWFFELCGANVSNSANVMIFLSSYQTFMNNYNMINSLMDDIAVLDTDGDMQITVEEVQSNNDKIGESKETPENKDPLILDLNRNGKFASTTDEGVHFDFEGDGFAEKTAWMEEGDGLIVFDRNANGLIDDLLKAV